MTLFCTAGREEYMLLKSRFSWVCTQLITLITHKSATLKAGIKVADDESPGAARNTDQVLSCDRKNRHLVPTWQDLEVKRSVQKVLKPLQDFTNVLPAEEYITLSYILFFIIF